MDGSRGRRLLRAVKESAVGEGAALCLPVGRPVEALLRPVATREGALNAADVRALTEWRNADEGRTSRWLSEAVGPDDTRILFMVDDPAGRTVGYMGLAFIDWEARTGEADAIVKGGEAAPGVMKRSLLTLLDWARTQLELRALGVRVRSDNTALEFYRKLGFREVRRTALRRAGAAGAVQWIEDDSLPAGEPSLVHMTLDFELRGNF
jgi:RimJ/RimL family protein N-acetyltransferase